MIKPAKVTNVFDFAQLGPLLSLIVSKLAGVAVSVNRNPTFKAQKLSNVKKVLAALREAGCVLDNVTSQGVVDGVPSDVLGLFTACMQRFAYLEDDAELARWINAALSAEGVQVRVPEDGKNLSPSFSNGIAMCALANHVLRHGGQEDLLVDLESLIPTSGASNCNLALVLLSHGGVPPVLAPDDIALGDTDSTALRYMLTLMYRAAPIPDNDNDAAAVSMEQSPSKLISSTEVAPSPLASRSLQAKLPLPASPLPMQRAQEPVQGNNLYDDADDDVDAVERRLRQDALLRLIADEQRLLASHVGQVSDRSFAQRLGTVTPAPPGLEQTRRVNAADDTLAQERMTTLHLFRKLKDAVCQSVDTENEMNARELQFQKRLEEATSISQRESASLQTELYALQDELNLLRENDSTSSRTEMANLQHQLSDANQRLAEATVLMRMQVSKINDKNAEIAQLELERQTLPKTPRELSERPSSNTYVNMGKAPQLAVYHLNQSSEEVTQLQGDLRSSQKRIEQLQTSDQRESARLRLQLEATQRELEDLQRTPRTPPPRTPSLPAPIVLVNHYSAAPKAGNSVTPRTPRTPRTTVVVDQAAVKELANAKSEIAQLRRDLRNVQETRQTERYSTLVNHYKGDEAEQARLRTLLDEKERRYRDEHSGLARRLASEHDQNIGLIDRINQLEKDQKREHDVLRKSLSVLTVERDDLATQQKAGVSKEEHERLQSRFAELNSRFQESSEKEALLEKENGRLERHISELEQQAERLQELEAEEVRLKEELAKSQAECERLKRMRETVEEREREIAQLQMEIEALESLSSSETGKLVDEVAALKEQISTLEGEHRRLEELRKVSQEYEQEIDRLRKRVAELESSSSDSEKLAAHISVIKEEFADLEEEKRHLELLHGTVDDREREISDLRKELAELESSSGSASKKLAMELAELEDVNQRLEGRMHSTLEEREEVIRELKEEVDRLQSLSSSASESQRVEITVLEKQVFDLAEENRQLEKLEDLHAEMMELKRSNAEKEEEVGQLRKQVGDTEFSSSQYEALKREHDLLASELNAQRSASRDATSSASHTQALQERVDILFGQLEQERDMVRKLEIELEEADAETDSVADALRSEIVKANQEVVRLQKLLDNGPAVAVEQRSIAELESAVPPEAEVEKDLDEATNLLQAQEQALVDLSVTLEQAEEQITELEQERDAFEEARDELEQERDELQEELDEIRSALPKADERLKELGGRLSAEEERAEKLETECERLRDELESMQDELDRQEDQLTATRASMESARSQISGEMSLSTETDPDAPTPAEVQEELERARRDRAIAMKVKDKVMLENSQLQSRLTLLQRESLSRTSSSGEGQLLAELTRKDGELAELRSRSTSAAEPRAVDSSKEQTEQIASLRRQLEEMHDNLRESGKTVLLREDELAEVRASLDEFEGQLALLRKELVDSNANVELLRQQLDQQKREADELGERLSDESQSLKEQVDRLRGERDEQTREAEERGEHLQVSKQEVNRLTRELDEEKLKAGERDELAAELKRSKEEAGLMHQELDEQKREAEEHRERAVELRLSKQEVEARSSDLERDLRDSKEQLAEAEKLSAEVDSLKKRLDDAQQSLNGKTEQLEALQDRLANAERAEVEVNVLKRELEEVREARDVAQGEARETRIQLDALRDSLAESVAECDRLLATKKAAERRAVGAEAECASLQSEVEPVRSKLKDAVQQVAQAEMETQTAEQRAKEASVQLEEEKEKLAGESERVSELEAKLATMSATEEATQDALREASRRADDATEARKLAEAAASEAQAAAEEANVAAEESGRRQTETEAQCRELEKQAQTSESRADAAEDRVRTSNDMRDTAVQKVAQASGMMEKMQVKMTRIQASYEEEFKQRSVLRDQLEEERAKSDELQAKLDASLVEHEVRVTNMERDEKALQEKLSKAGPPINKFEEARKKEELLAMQKKIGELERDVDGLEGELHRGQGWEDRERKYREAIRLLGERENTARRALMSVEETSYQRKMDVAAERTRSRELSSDLSHLRSVAEEQREKIRMYAASMDESEMLRRAQAIANLEQVTREQQKENSLMQERLDVTEKALQLYRDAEEEGGGGNTLSDETRRLFAKQSKLLQTKLTHEQSWRRGVEQETRALQRVMLALHEALERLIGGANNDLGEKTIISTARRERSRNVRKTRAMHGSTASKISLLSDIIQHAAAFDGGQDSHAILNEALEAYIRADETASKKLRKKYAQLEMDATGDRPLPVAPQDKRMVLSLAGALLDDDSYAHVQSAFEVFVRSYEDGAKSVNYDERLFARLDSLDVVHVLQQAFERFMTEQGRRGMQVYEVLRRAIDAYLATRL